MTHNAFVITGTFSHVRWMHGVRQSMLCKMSRVEKLEENNQDDSGHKSLPQDWSAVYLEQLRFAILCTVYPFM